MMVGSGALITLMVVFAKLAADTHAIIEVTFFRNLVGAICIAVIIAGSPKGFSILKTTRPWDHVVRGTVGLIGLSLNFWAAKMLPLADASALFFAMPLMLTVLSIPLLSETVDWRRWIGVAMGFAGILVVAQPTGHTEPFGVLIALSGAFCTALVAIAIRRLGSTEPELRTVFYFFTFSTLASGAFLPWWWTMPSFSSLVYLVAAGLAGTLGQIMLTRAYAMAPAAFLSPFNYLQIIYATAFGWLLWSELPSAAVVLGSAVVIGAGLLTIYLEKTRKPEGVPANG